MRLTGVVRSPRGDTHVRDVPAVLRRFALGAAAAPAAGGAETAAAASGAETFPRRRADPLTAPPDADGGIPIDSTVIVERVGRPEGVALGMGELQRLSVGSATTFRGTRPAIRATAGTGQLILSFDDAAARDRAAAELVAEAGLDLANRRRRRRHRPGRRPRRPHRAARRPTPTDPPTWRPADGRLGADRPRGRPRGARRRYHEFMTVPDLSGGLYVLDAGASDTQSPHTEDELYVVMGAGRWSASATTIGRSGRARSCSSRADVPAPLPRHHRAAGAARRVRSGRVLPGEPSAAPTRPAEAQRPSSAPRPDVVVAEEHVGVVAGGQERLQAVGPGRELGRRVVVPAQAEVQERRRSAAGSAARRRPALGRAQSAAPAAPGRHGLVDVPARILELEGQRQVAGQAARSAASRSSSRRDAVGDAEQDGAQPLAEGPVRLGQPGQAGLRRRVAHASATTPPRWALTRTGSRRASRPARPATLAARRLLVEGVVELDRGQPRRRSGGGSRGAQSRRVEARRPARVGETARPGVAGGRRRGRGPGQRWTSAPRRARWPRIETQRSGSPPGPARSATASIDRSITAGRPGRGVQEVLVDAAQVGPRRGAQAGEPGRGQDGLRAARVGEAGVALDEAVDDEPIDEPGHAALADRIAVGQLAHPDPPVGRPAMASRASYSASDRSCSARSSSSRRRGRARAPPGTRATARAAGRGG